MRGSRRGKGLGSFRGQGQQEPRVIQLDPSPVLKTKAAPPAPVRDEISRRLGSLGPTSRAAVELK